MNKNIIIVLAGGFFIAILVALLVSMTLGGGAPQTDEEIAEVTEILVATRDLKKGDDINASNAKWQSWPETSLFSGAIIRNGEEGEADAAPGRLSQIVSEGQPILRSFLIVETRGNFLAATLKEGHRAMAVSVNAEILAGGFIGPGDFVDIILTHTVRVRNPDDPQVAATVERFASETVLENIRVLAVDQETVRENEEAKVGRTITLEVNRQQSEKLALAMQMGEITLSLRGLGDEENLSGNVQNSQDFTTDVKTSRVLNNLVEMQKKENRDTNLIRIYDGDRLQQIAVPKIEGKTQKEEAK